MHLRDSCSHLIIIPLHDSKATKMNIALTEPAARCRIWSCGLFTAPPLQMRHAKCGTSVTAGKLPKGPQPPGFVSRTSLSVDSSPDIWCYSGQFEDLGSIATRLWRVTLGCATYTLVDFPTGRFYDLM